MGEKEIQLSNELFRTALQEAGTKISPGVYSATPNAIGAVIDRLHELCKERGVDPITYEPLQKEDGVTIPD